MSQAMNAELLKSKTLADMLQVIKKYYDVDSCKPGDLGKQLFIVNLKGALQALGAKPR